MAGAEKTPTVGIERGKIIEIKGTTFKVESYTRGGVKTRFIEAVNQYINEFEGEPPRERKFEYLLGDEVFYFMFPDGRGMILGKMMR